MKIKLKCNNNTFFKNPYLPEDITEWDGHIDGSMCTMRNGFFYKKIIEDDRTTYYIYVDLNKNFDISNNWNETISRAVQMLRDKKISEILE
jgi:hypothetical protein